MSNKKGKYNNCEENLTYLSPVLRFLVQRWYPSMKIITIIVLIAVVIYGCDSNELKVDSKSPDLEMEVINDILPSLIPKDPPCMVVPIEGETHEDYDKRLQTFYDEVDSVGRKIEVSSLLSKLDSNYIEVYKDLENSRFAEYLLNAPNVDKQIDSTMFRGIGGIQIKLISEPQSNLGELSDCYTLGQFNISRVGFNSDSTKAAFRCFIHNGISTAGEIGVVNAELRGGIWQKVK